MDIIIAFVIVACLWSIARTLKRIERRIAALRLTVEIPIYGDDGGGEPKEKPRADNVVAFKKSNQ